MGGRVAREQCRWQALALSFYLALGILTSLSWISPSWGEVVGCVAGGSTDYAGFSGEDFSFLDDTVIIDNQLVLLNTGMGAVNKERIVLTSEQEVKATFLYEGAGYTMNHFGYFLLSQAKTAGYVGSDGTMTAAQRTSLKEKINFNDADFDSDTFHYIFKCVNDNNNNGILEYHTNCGSASNGDFAATEAALESVVDGTGFSFVVNGDGILDARDMTKSLGTIAEGEELVFFLIPNGNFNQVLFSKTAFNNDVYDGDNPCHDAFWDCLPKKKYWLGLPQTSEGVCQPLGSGWLSGSAFTRLSETLGIHLRDTDVYEMEICTHQPFSHIVIGAPADDPTQWVLGWEDLYGGGDTDHNDVVFKIQRKTGGRAQSNIISEEIAGGEAYITYVDIEVQEETVNCVSSSVDVAATFEAENFQGEFQFQPEDDCVFCENNSTGCSNNTFSGSVDVEEVRLTGTINNSFDRANLSGSAQGTVTLTFDSCQKENAAVCEAVATPTFDSVPVTFTVSAQNLSINSDGGFSGNFTITGSINVTNTDNDICFQNWAGTVQKTISVSGTLNGDWNTRTNTIDYYFSVNNGDNDNWTLIDHWDEVTENQDDTTTKRVYIDVLGLGLIGNELVWKGVLQSKDDHCDPPKIIDLKIDYGAAGSNDTSRSDPVVLGNVLYSASMETPAPTWSDLTRNRGHLRAYKIYDPSAPSTALYDQIWDAAETLHNRDLTDNARSIRIAMGTPQTVTDETAGTGDGTTLTFSGTLAHGRILSGSITISDTVETFTDSGVDTLQGDKGGTGTINRFTGEYSIQFVNAPIADAPVQASYSYYTPSGGGNEVLGEFSTDYVTNDMLAIDDTFIGGLGYRYDFNGDGSFTDNDRITLIKWVQGFKYNASTGAYVERDWPLGSIDHSTPAVVGPPGLPLWYYGQDVSQEERDAFDLWAESLKERSTVAYVGSKDGMLHAFDAGEYRHGGNRGSFEGQDYGDGEELWAFIPNNCLPRVKYHLNRSLPGADPPYVDASAAAEDVSQRVGADYVFKTVLLSAEGAGGDTIFALDITDPLLPKFMWEYANPALWRSKSSPAIGKIVRLNSNGQPVWVSFFVSGRTKSDEHPSIFAVNVLTGELLAQIPLDEPGDDNLGAVLSGSPAILDTDGNGYIDRIYVGDDHGYMYRVNLPDDSSTVFDVSKIKDCVLVKVPQPIYASPSVYVQHEYDPADGHVTAYHVKVMFGTGDNPYFNDNPNSSEVTYKFYVFDDDCAVDYDSSIIELVMVDNDDSVCDCSGMRDESATPEDGGPEWAYTLPAGQKVWAEAFAAAGKVYFGTATSDTEDPCSPQADTKGGVYYYDLENEEGGQLIGDVGNVLSLTVYDEHLYLKATSFDQGTSVNVEGSGNFDNPTTIGTTYRTNKRQGTWRQIIR